MIWLLLAASLAASREPPVVLDPRLERFLAAPQLWHRLLQRSTSEADYVAGTGPRSGAIAAGGCWCWLFSAKYREARG